MLRASFITQSCFELCDLAHTTLAGLPPCPPTPSPSDLGCWHHRVEMEVGRWPHPVGEALLLASSCCLLWSLVRSCAPSFEAVLKP